MSQSGFVLIAVAGLWIAYLVPHLLRNRQRLLDSRVEDRFSEQLRVLRVAQPPVRTSGPPARVVRVHLHPGGGGVVDRPHPATERALVVAARREALARQELISQRRRRQARVRRRRVAAGLLLLAALAAWSTVTLALAPVWVAVLPSAALALLVVAGPFHRSGAVVPATPTPHVEVRTRRTGSAQVPQAPSRPEADGWVPVPVPRPAYLMKPAAPRVEPAWVEPLSRPASPAHEPAAAPAAAPAAEAPAAASRRAVAVDLDEVLERRRAAGE